MVFILVSDILMGCFVSPKPKVEYLSRLESELREIEVLRRELLRTISMSSDLIESRLRNASYVIFLLREVLLHAEKRGMDWRLELRKL